MIEIDYSRAPGLGADQKTRGLWERDWQVKKATEKIIYAKSKNVK